ncbi:MAG: PIN domain-containing protein [Proteobacteria bacterium]|nr:PIN domain-containing protein [Pseudomonadota bacterium]
MIEDESGHEKALAALSSTRDGYASTHSLAECFATLTGGRITSRLTPAIAAKMVEFNVAKRLTLVSLTQAEIAAALKTAASVGVRGGAIYDVLLLAAARKCGADRIHTLNHRHFAAFAPDLRDRLYDGQTSR